MSKLTEVDFSTPRLAIAKGSSLNVPDTLSSGTMIMLNKSDGKQIEVGVKIPSTVTQYLTLKALKFPFINLLWLGTIIMAVGFVVSMVRRIQLSKSQA
jgi:cytochrome c-type biogenesis protein CcmF